MRHANTTPRHEENRNAMHNKRNRVAREILWCARTVGQNIQERYLSSQATERDKGDKTSYEFVSESTRPKLRTTGSPVEGLERVISGCSDLRSRA